MNIIDGDSIVYWHHKTGEIDPQVFFESFNEIQELQPMVFATLGMMRETINNEKAYIGFLRFVYIVWRCLESSDARVRTQKLGITDLKNHINQRIAMLMYISGTDDLAEINLVLNTHMQNHRQWNLMAHVMGGLFTEHEVFPVKTGVLYQMLAWFCGVIDAFDEQMD